MIPFTVMIYERIRPTRRVIAVLGDTPPTPSGGGGGWQAVSLPKRAAVVVWQGRDGMTMQLPIILGHALGGAPPLRLEHTALLEAWRPKTPTKEPPSLKLLSPGDAVPYQSLSWVLSDVQWGDAVADKGARRTLQKMTLQLLEYNPDEKLKAQNTKQKQGPARMHPTHYTVRKGDTLSTIAKKFDIPGGWRVLGQLQTPPINDPRHIHVGQRLLLGIFNQG